MEKGGGGKRWRHLGGYGKDDGWWRRGGGGLKTPNLWWRHLWTLPNEDYHRDFQNPAEYAVDRITLYSIIDYFLTYYRVYRNSAEFADATPLDRNSRLIIETINIIENIIGIPRKSAEFRKVGTVLYASIYNYTNDTNSYSCKIVFITNFRYFKHYFYVWFHGESRKNYKSRKVGTILYLNWTCHGKTYLS